jgi:hypothetical protein
MSDRIREDFALARDVKIASERSPLVWAVSYIALPKGEMWSFEDRKWQLDIMDDNSRSLVVMKPTQIGMTTIMTIKMLWFVSHIKSRAMVTFPRRDDVQDYVASTLDPIMEASEFLRTRIGRTDTIRLKRINNSFIHIMEASVTPRMLPVDILVNDEVDMSNPDNIEQFAARLDASKYAYHYRFSTPTVSGYGIDSEFERSTASEWMVRCVYCSLEQKLDWDSNVLFEGDEEPVVVCSSCHNELPIDSIVNGRWVSQNPDSDTHGYHITHLMLPITRPIARLVDEAKVMDQKTFHNLRLGRPWRPVGGSMSPQLIKDNCFLTGHAREDWPREEGQYFLGADQGNEIYVVIGRLTKAEDLEVVYAEHMKPKIEGEHFDRLGALMRLFNIEYAVIDAQPNKVSAYKLCREFHGHMSAGDIGALDYPFKFYGFDGDSAYRMGINRTDLIDGLRDWMVSGKIQLWGTWNNRDPIIEGIIQHCSALKRDTTKRRVPGGGERVVGIWRKAGADHFAFALGLLRLAAVVNPRSSNFRFTYVGEGMDGQTQQSTSGTQTGPSVKKKSVV